VIFLDPPYEDHEAYESTLGALGGELSSLVAVGGLVIAEHRSKQDLEERYGSLVRGRVLKQGDAALSFFEPFSGHSEESEKS